MRTTRRSTRGLQRLLLALLCVFAAISGFAQSSPYKPGSPLLMWKVSSKDSSKPGSSYLLGSVHLGDKSLYPLPAVIENAFQSSSVLIVEVDLRKIDPLQMSGLMATSGTYPAGDDLSKHITPATQTRLNEFFGAYGMPAALFFRMRPWMLGIEIQMLPLLKEGLNPNDGIDSYFLGKAGDKRVEQLEDAEWQIKMLAGLPDDLSDSWLSSALDQARASKDHWSKLESYWSQGAAGKIDELTTSTSMGDSREEKAFERRLREDRNPHMTDRLEKCIQTGDSCFMVVGAAHAVGSEGIVKQLQAHGYRVEQAVVGKDSPR